MAQNGDAKGWDKPTADEIYVMGFVREGLPSLDARAMTEPAAVVPILLEFGSELHNGDLDVRPQVLSRALAAASGVLIDAAGDAEDREALEAANAWARRIVDDQDGDDALRQHCAYNLSNGLSHLAKMTIRQASEADTSIDRHTQALWDQRDLMAEARRLLRQVADDPACDPGLRSLAACNLGNDLDEMGRWLEAYEWYQRSLALDPTNGNAAGNIAVALGRMLHCEWVASGHLAAVYNHYLKMAQSLAEETARIAGEATARRYAEMPLIEGDVGHFAHLGDPADDYQQWVAEHRLALTPAVEGLGHNHERWDNAQLSQARSKDGAVPAVFTMLDSLKAEFVAIRRMAYNGMRQVEDHHGQQSAEDSGVYGDARDGTIHGEQVAQLVIAQRTALDVLDKLAVTTNEHLRIGVAPGRIDYRGYWAPRGIWREGLMPPASDGRALLAVADLANDLASDGFYEHSQMLRNAGTHRVIAATVLPRPAAAAKEALSVVGLDALMESTLEALRVARAAFLYIIGLLEEWADYEDEQDPVASRPIYDQLPRGQREGGPR